MKTHINCVGILLVISNPSALYHRFGFKYHNNTNAPDLVSIWGTSTTRWWNQHSSLMAATCWIMQPWWTSDLKCTRSARDRSKNPEVSHRSQTLWPELEVVSCLVAILHNVDDMVLHAETSPTIDLIMIWSVFPVAWFNHRRNRWPFVARRTRGKSQEKSWVQPRAATAFCCQQFEDWAGAERFQNWMGEWRAEVRPREMEHLKQVSKDQEEAWMAWSELLCFLNLFDPIGWTSQAWQTNRT